MTGQYEYEVTYNRETEAWRIHIPCDRGNPTVVYFTKKEELEAVAKASEEEE